MAASKFTKISAEKREKTFTIKMQQNIVKKHGWRQDFKEYLKGEIITLNYFKFNSNLKSLNEFNWTKS